MRKTVRLTVAQAIVRFLDNQYVVMDGKETKFVEGIFTIFGHGIAVGLGEALDCYPGDLKVLQGRNEQGMCHAAIAYAKQNNRRKIIPCASSIGPGAANMITACATATVNNLPLLVFPADTFASRQPDPVLQQLEQSNSLALTTNDAFKPVCKYWDRILRPEMLMTALINAMRVLTDPAETGACCIALCQDVEGEAYDYPEYFFEKRVHRITRVAAADEEIDDIVSVIKEAAKPVVIVGGGVRYSEAGEAVERFCEEFNIPFCETQGGKSACRSSHPYCLGGVGVTGTYASNVISREADVVIAVGTRLSDFTTSSKFLYQKEGVRIVTVNNNRYHAYKMDAVKAVGDARVIIEQLATRLKDCGYQSKYTDEIRKARKWWDQELEWLGKIQYTGEGFEPIISKRDLRTLPEFVRLTGGTLTQTEAIAAIQETIEEDATIITAGGSLPSCLQRMWKTDKRGGYHAEYGYSCMGYEVAAALGVKMAEPDFQVYCLVGDSSFQMLHSEIMTIIQERKKVNILVFDNCGFGCINNLEMVHGVGSIATEFRYTEGKMPSGDLIPVDYAKIAEGYGLKAYTCRTKTELEAALIQARAEQKACLFDLKVLPKTMTDGYESWWNVGVAEISQKESVRKAYENMLCHRKMAKEY
ncbi:3D-(3,5/4)-trihydroxycyclohexane-1,2-dione acylhydrolase (decyclizing) [Muricomes sp. OA1]|uniref:3D-(3,5/4)-trihydroxycyclohexane-1,2-dione acylhydrolase (Decyclizing) n=1 Tax=Hungatella hathewayi TaxID=154046 RepID=A0A3E2WY03_9FIRM|nr:MULTISPECIES: 3D-(3,5/4)-trihydroxycyclohexane-1,2-dione acylhydrolase (decyclizing) [Clostridia]MCH1974608.1 3D-(3,5/4)-trihydroxycyclohexane-1,2-dione acylhydrolase (decyclizing) [Muricomes sp. OA1]RGC33043.1 3D-(3,5/4)-trihydroxycyclohexane-1,2-dione acylhydrolase (decyclizing) [Hungatella hathewayi]GKH33389.1 3D-(3,5/4)-trihydroxycyclohexane-1,2-dione hydrolase [Faecalicatena contorta]